MFVICLGADPTHWNYRKCLSFNYVGKCRPHCQTYSQTDLLSVRGSFSSLFNPNTIVMHGNHLTSEARMSDKPGNQPPPLSLLPIFLCFVLMDFSPWKEAFSQHSWGFPRKLSCHSIYSIWVQNTPMWSKSCSIPNKFTDKTGIATKPQSKEFVQ